MVVNCVNPWLPIARCAAHAAEAAGVRLPAPWHLPAAVPAMDKIVQRIERISASRSPPGLQHRPAAQPAPASGTADLRSDHLPEAIPPEQVSQMITQNLLGLPGAQNVRIWMARALVGLQPTSAQIGGSRTCARSTVNHGE